MNYQELARLRRREAEERARRSRPISSGYAGHRVDTVIVDDYSHLSYGSSSSSYDSSSSSSDSSSSSCSYD